MASAQSEGISLSGSIDQVALYLDCAMHQILLETGVVPKDTFKCGQEFGQNVSRTEDPEVVRKFNELLKYVKRWMEMKTLEDVQLCLKEKSTNECKQKWRFQVTNTQPTADFRNSDISKNIAKVMRQVTSFVARMPKLGDCYFTFHVVDNSDLLPPGWTYGPSPTIRNQKSSNGFSFSNRHFGLVTEALYSDD